MAPAMPCKTCNKRQQGETGNKTNDFKSKFACIWEASESTRMRVEESLPIYHEDHIAGKGDNSLQHCILVHKFIPMLQAMKVPSKSSFCLTDGHLSSEECRISDKAPKIQRSSCTRR